MPARVASGDGAAVAVADRITFATPAGSTHIGTCPQPSIVSHCTAPGKLLLRRALRVRMKSRAPKTTVTSPGMLLAVKGALVLSNVASNAVAVARSSIVRTAAAYGMR